MPNAAARTSICYCTAMFSEGSIRRERRTLVNVGARLTKYPTLYHKIIFSLSTYDSDLQRAKISLRNDFLWNLLNHNSLTGLQVNRS